MNYKEFFKIAEPEENEIWADVGCGPGYITIPLAQVVSKVFAIDISEEMLKICRRRADEKSIDNIEYVKSEGDATPLQDNSVNKVLLANVFHEFRERDFVAQEIGRILRRGGTAFIIDWKYEEMDFGPPLNHRLKPETVIRSFEKNGFELKHQWEIYEFNYVLGFEIKF
ncbi:MAG: class I SAM-dependent methyltransferase [Chlorobi bacterium]|nr:class I SAM-dependent methyltransferase [Chlorobiota bacterium]